MTLDELVKKVGGEYVRNRARVRKDRDYIVIGEFIDGKMQMTPAGVEMAKTFEAQPKRRGRPRKVDPALAPQEELPLEG